MQMAIKDGQLLIKDTDSIQYNIIKGWNKMKWSKQKQMLIGPLDYDLLEKLSRICKLPPSVEKVYKQMAAVMKAVDDERLKEKPTPMVKYPVKLPLFAHQCRGANMALLTFGIIQPESN